MNVLVVEDNDNKANAICDVLSSLEIPIEVRRALFLSEAAQYLAGGEIDLIILDLVLPFIRGGEEQAGAGLELLRLARGKHARNSSAMVLGLTAFAGELPSARERFEQSGALIVEFDEDGRWRSKLERVALDVAERKGAALRTDVLIVTALDEERAPYSQLAAEPGSRSALMGLNIETLRFSGFSATVVRTRQMGLVAATLDASLAISLLQPKVVAMSGICAGLSGRTELGQLLIASPAWEYQAGKWSEDGFEIAPTQIPIPPKTRVIVEQRIQRENFIADLERLMPTGTRRPPAPVEAKLAPAASGSAVIANAERLAHIEPQHRKVAAIDMETYGLYAAAFEAPWPPDHFFAVKCVVDLADGAKNDDLHAYGTWLSAGAALELASTLLASG